MLINLSSYNLMYFDNRGIVESSPEKDLGLLVNKQLNKADNMCSKPREPKISWAATKVARQSGKGR